MVEAAFVAVRHDARIGARYQRLATRIGPMKARVAVARQMLEWVWEMLDHDAEYRTQDKELVKRKLQKIKRQNPESNGPGRVSPPLHKRGAAQRPLPPLPLPGPAENDTGRGSPACRFLRIEGGWFLAAAVRHSSGSARNACRFGHGHA